MGREHSTSFEKSSLIALGVKCLLYAFSKSLCTPACPTGPYKADHLRLLLFKKDLCSQTEFKYPGKNMAVGVRQAWVQILTPLCGLGRVIALHWALAASLEQWGRVMGRKDSPANTRPAPVTAEHWECGLLKLRCTVIVSNSCWISKT